MFVIKEDAFSSFFKVFFFIFADKELKKVTNQVTYRGSQWLVDKQVILDMLSAMKGELHWLSFIKQDIKNEINVYLFFY